MAYPLDKTKFTLQVPDDLLERARNIAYWTPGCTLSSLFLEGLRKQVESFEKKEGAPFKSRPEELKPGRRMR